MGHKMGFDATAKIAGEEAGGHPVRDWPPAQIMDESTRSLVDTRWADYGLS